MRNRLYRGTSSLARVQIDGVPDRTLGSPTALSLGEE